MFLFGILETKITSCYISANILAPILKGQHKLYAMVDLAFYFDTSPQTINMIVDQIKANTITIRMIVKGLVQSKHLVFAFSHIKPDTFI